MTNVFIFFILVLFGMLVYSSEFLSKHIHVDEDEQIESTDEIVDEPIEQK